MAKVLILWPADAAVRIGAAEASRLASLGVSKIALLRDADSVGIVLDGWAFDPVQSGRAAATTLGSESECRVFPGRPEPVPIAVSCHRVLHADGGLGGYSGGLDRKRYLLALEGSLPA